MPWRSKADHSPSNISTKQEPVRGSDADMISQLYLHRLHSDAKKKTKTKNFVHLPFPSSCSCTVCGSLPTAMKLKKQQQYTEYNRPATRNITHLLSVLTVRVALLYHQHHIYRLLCNPDETKPQTKIADLGKIMFNKYCSVTEFMLSS